MKVRFGITRLQDGRNTMLAADSHEVELPAGQFVGSVWLQIDDLEVMRLPLGLDEAHLAVDY